MRKVNFVVYSVTHILATAAHNKLPTVYTEIFAVRNFRCTPSKQDFRDYIFADHLLQLSWFLRELLRYLHFVAYTCFHMAVKSYLTTFSIRKIALHGHVEARVCNKMHVHIKLPHPSKYGK